MVCITLSIGFNTTSTLLLLYDQIPKIKPRKKGYKPQLRWQLTHRQAHRVIKKLMPHLFNKDKIKKGKEVLNYYRKKDS